MDLSMVNSHQEWADLYQKLVYWELELEGIEDPGMFEILESQKMEANTQFCKFIDKNYPDWFDAKTDAPTMSHTLFRDKVVPHINNSKSTYIILTNELM